MHKAQALIICTVLLACCGACIPARISHVATDTSISSSLTRYPCATLAIMPFMSASGDPELGTRIAWGFAERLVARDFFCRIAVLPAFSRLQADNLDLVLATALEQARTEACDFVLLGTVEQYQPGDASDARVVISARVIRVRNPIDIWYARASARGKPGKTFLLYDHQLAAGAPQPDEIAKKVIADLTADMLPRSWWPRLRRQAKPAADMPQPVRELPPQDSELPSTDTEPPPSTDTEPPPPTDTELPPTNTAESPPAD